jgi:hypothetical protein
VALLKQDGRSLLLEAHDEEMDHLVAWLAAHHIEHLEIREPSLDELFIRYYSEAPERAEPTS